MRLFFVIRKVLSSGTAYLLVSDHRQIAVIMMPAHRTTPGPRFTRPSINATDIRDGSVHVDDLAEIMREAAVADRLGLGAITYSPLPSSLRDLTYVCCPTAGCGVEGTEEMVR
jgi:hypothetical protein